MNILRWIYFFVGHPLVDGVIREERELSNIANCYKEKEDGLERTNYCRLKFTEQILKIVKRVVESLIRQLVNKNKTDRFHTITWNCRSHFHLVSITVKRLSQKEKFSLSIYHIFYFPLRKKPLTKSLRM